MSAKLLKSWCIPDGSFLPYSLYSIGEDTKAVLIVPGEDQIITLVIKNCKRNIQADDNPHKVSRIKSSGSLVETVVTSQSTVSRACDGKLMVFGSFRDCSVLEGVAGVKAIGTMQGESKLIVIRLAGGRHLQLEVYDGLVGCQLGNIEQTFDLSWEKEAFDTTRTSQVHKVKTVEVTCYSVKFFKRFLNCKDIAENSELIFFSIDNGLYWLKILEGSYEIVTVKLYPAIILDFNYASSTGCFAVLASNAVLHIYSISEDTNCLLLQEEKRHLGVTVDSHLFVTDLSTILYSNGFHVIQLRYFYSELSKTILFSCKETQIVGVVGITYLHFANIAICITDNRLFYSVPINKLTDVDAKQKEEYFELTHEVLSQANQMICFLTNEATVETRIAKQTELEQVQIDILANSLNQNLSKLLIKVEMKWHKHWPNLCYSTLILNENMQMRNMFAQIDIIFTTGTKDILHRQRNWLMAVSFDNTVSHIPLDKIDYVGDSIIRLIVPFEQRRFKTYRFLPMELQMIITVPHHQDRLILDNPLQIRNLENFANLLDASRNEPKLMNQENQSSNVISALIRHSEQLPPVETPVFNYHIKGNIESPTVVKLLNLIGIPFIVDAGIETVIRKAFLQYGTEICEVEHGDGNEFQFKSPSADLLFIVKVLCSETFQQKSTSNVEHLKASRLQLMQCENSLESIASYYRQIRTSSDSWRMTH